MAAEICASSGMVIPEGGSVFCSCKRHWTKGESVPLHNRQGHYPKVERIARLIDRAMEVRPVRDAVRSVRSTKPGNVVQKGLMRGQKVYVS
jgi:hypothetical protein